MTLWKVKGGITTDYIRANSLDEAKKIFDDKHLWSKAEEFQAVDEKEKIFAVYFTDNPYDPAWFSGTKTQVTKAANLYIRQWQLDAVIDKIIQV